MKIKILLVIAVFLFAVHYNAAAVKTAHAMSPITEDDNDDDKKKEKAAEGTNDETDGNDEAEKNKTITPAPAIQKDVEEKVTYEIEKDPKKGIIIRKKIIKPKN